MNTLWRLTIATLLSCFAVPVHAGPMQGINGHTASGSATLESGTVELGEDFRFDGGPDVYVALSQDGEIRVLGKLRANEGAQSYSLPAGNNGSGVDGILLWCKQYNVTLGTASVE